MGYELRRALREVLGPDIVGLMRAVALELADDANPNTRESWASLEDLARWTGAKDVSVVRTTLKRLAAAGWEFRVPLGVGKDGRVLFAVPGRRLTFKVPAFEGVTTVAPKGEPGAALAPEGVTTVPTEGTTVPTEGTVVTPFSSSSSSLSSLGEQPAATGEREINENEQRVLDAYIEALGRKPTPKTISKIRAQTAELLAADIPAWWIADRARELPQYGTDLAKHCEMSNVPVETIRPADIQKVCDRGHDKFNPMIRDPERGLINCPDCHPAEIARHRRQGAA